MGVGVCETVAETVSSARGRKRNEERKDDEAFRKRGKSGGGPLMAKLFHEARREKGSALAHAL